MLERELVEKMKRYLSSLGDGIFYFKEHGGTYGTNGVPDIICCYKGKFLGLEAKVPGGRLTELQKRAIAKINAAGGIAQRVESVEDVRAAIRQVDIEQAPPLKQPLVFVCSPYRGNIEENERQAKGYCRFVYENQCIPFAPHLLFTRFLDDRKEEERNAGIAMGLSMLALCSELWVFGEPTTGMKFELEAAQWLGIKIYRFDENCREVAL